MADEKSTIRAILVTPDYKMKEVMLTAHRGRLDLEMVWKDLRDGTPAAAMMMDPMSGRIAHERNGPVAGGMNLCSLFPDRFQFGAGGFTILQCPHGQEVCFPHMIHELDSVPRGLMYQLAEYQAMMKETMVNMIFDSSPILQRWWTKITGLDQGLGGLPIDLANLPRIVLTGDPREFLQSRRR
jgi:hypothetical protein